MAFGGYSYCGLRGRHKVYALENKPKQKKTVFGTQANTAHTWAQQTIEYGRSSDGRLWFDGPTIYSYGTHFPIATFTSATFKGKRVVLFSTEKYSPTTESHKGEARGALRGLDVHIMAVADVMPPRTLDHALAHTYNLQKMLEGVDAQAAEFIKPNKRAWLGYDNNNNHMRQIEDTAANRCEHLRQADQPILDYCHAFGVEPPVAELGEYVETKCAAIIAAFAKYNDPAAVAKREKAAGRRQLKWAAVMARYHGWREGVCACPPLDQLPARIQKELERERRGREWASHRKTITPEQWIAGEGNSTSLTWTYRDTETLVRRIGDRLETSRGAVVPWQHAVAAFYKAQHCRRDGRTWETNGDRVPVGSYLVERIDSEGNLKAGCHTIEWDEMLRLAVREIPQSVRPTFTLPVAYNGGN